MKNDEMPISIAIALAINPNTIQKAAMFSREQEQGILAEAHAVKSRNEMSDKG